MTTTVNMAAYAHDMFCPLTYSEDHSHYLKNFCPTGCKFIRCAKWEDERFCRSSIHSL